jgi:hypothetical protein
MKNKSSSLECQDAKPKMKLELPLKSQGFLISVFVNDTMENLEPESVTYRRVLTECAAIKLNLVHGHA